MTTANTQPGRALSDDDLGAVSGGAVSVLELGPIRIAGCPGMTSIGIRGVGQVVFTDLGNGNTNVTTHPLPGKPH